jgi:hypothetical protein
MITEQALAFMNDNSICGVGFGSGKDFKVNTSRNRMLDLHCIAEISCSSKF